METSSDQSSPDILKINLNTPKIETNNKSDLILSNEIRKGERRNSVFIPRPQIFFDEKEDILINISKRQRKMSDYSTESDSISFNGRENILEWCHNILEKANLTKNERASIFHRFCTAYDLIMEKLFLINNTIKEYDELKILVITIFLLTYKLEGLSIAKISISNLIEAFLSELNIDKNQLSEKILHYEIKILELMDFNPQIFEDNSISQLSYILYDLFKKKYNIKLSEKEEKKIENIIDYLNDNIEFSDKMLFNLIPIDKGMISFYSAAFYYFINDPNIHSQLKDFLGYLKNTLKIIKIETETIEGYAMIYFQHIKEKEDDINNI
jgi:hypothetical protein